MSQDEPRKRSPQLTPISGELEAQSEWAPPEPPNERRPKPEAGPPTTTLGILRHGVKRLLLIVGGLSSGAAVLSLLIVHFGGAAAAETFPVVFFIVGALVAGGGLWSTLGGQDWMPETGYTQFEKESWARDAFAYFGVGASIVGIGVLLDFLL